MYQNLDEHIHAFEYCPYIPVVVVLVVMPNETMPDNHSDPVHEP